MKLKVKVVPGSSRDEVVGWLGDAIKIKVAVQPEKGKANKAVVALLAEQLGVSVNQIVIAAGKTSANKVLEITGLTTNELNARLPNG